MNHGEVRTGSRLGAALLVACAAIFGSGCGSEGARAPQTRETPDGRLSSYHFDNPSGAIALLDAAGQPIPRGSTTPYSPEQTCGACHDTSVVTQGYHFQQGRTNADGTMRVSDTFNPLKSWLLSDGMYGKT